MDLYTNGAGISWIRLWSMGTGELRRGAAASGVIGPLAVFPEKEISGRYLHKRLSSAA